MMIRFTKMLGRYDDFMVVDGVTQKIFFSADLIRRLANRHSGIGFSRLLLIEPPYDPELDFHFRLFDSEGRELEHCHSGAGCLVRYVTGHYLVKKHELAVSTVAGILHLRLDDDDNVRMLLGRPTIGLELGVRDGTGVRAPQNEAGAPVPPAILTLGGDMVLVVPVQELGDLDPAAVSRRIVSPDLPLQPTGVVLIECRDEHSARVAVSSSGHPECIGGAALVWASKQGLLKSPAQLDFGDYILGITYRQDVVSINTTSSVVFEGSFALD